MEAKRYLIPTPHGEVSLVFANKPRDEVVVIIHGAGRRAFQLRSWLAHDVVLAELPGHDVAPMIEGDLATYAAAYEAALAHVWPGLPVTVVGESLGGLVALQMSGRVIAVDPPLEPTPEVEHELRVGFVATWLKPILRTEHWHLLDNLGQDVEIICPTRSILPEKSIDRIQGYPRVHLSRAEGGHVLLDENPDAVLNVLRKEKLTLSKAR
ncbi:alpha/beta fold hydrolase [Phenylobacterium sp.]|uniref:alpha/beta fold hydrolase n=1 Tax=Phenylobacterium sp. TaxID=1871053 RepID=UPI00272F0A98|nr:alpha/beta hydrolase [Phenylobacterium sp.]MDP1616778.1 alpha/beta hydrolase [Phenylobacterium sp.]MDP1988276.1 alpha/beta hydrolase [Phenylobacterium sp.]